jgi:hypothetical protein
MSERSEALARTFEDRIAEFIAEVEQCSDEKWKAICGDEKWSVASTAHHVAFQWPLEQEYLDSVTKGEPAPTYTWDDINKRNADHAAKFTKCSKDQAIKALRDGAPAMAAFVRGLSDQQLDRTMSMPLANGANVSTTQLINGGILIGHVEEHLKSIRAAG